VHALTASSRDVLRFMALKHNSKKGRILMVKKNVIVSRSGLTTCPSCMSHITIDANLAQTECPFCHTNLVAERRQDGGVFGHNTLQTLKKSKSAMLAAALGASLSMAACGGDNNSEDNNTSMDQGVDMIDEAAKDMPPSLDAAYGGPPIDFGFEEDMD
jgi:predicted RNA-binding Zn-ribbon protein involved in translation (DUF1610 family)